MTTDVTERPQLRIRLPVLYRSRGNKEADGRDLAQTRPATLAGIMAERIIPERIQQIRRNEFSRPIPIAIA
jgi:hypothetical protein